MFLSKNNEPILYEEVLWLNQNFEKSYISWDQNSRKTEDIYAYLHQAQHFVFLVHGFKGSIRDMQKISNMLVLRCPKIKPIIWKSIQEHAEDTTFDIEKLGTKLAYEIHHEILENHEEDTEYKISFIGHSLGGLLIRAALWKLRMHKEKFQTLMTLGTPHWGYMHSKSKLLSLGIWMYDKVATNPVLTQIRLGDSKDIRETKIYELSEKEEIGFFKNIVILGSEQDTFASIETSLIKESDRMKRLKKWKQLQEMQENLQ